MKKVRSSAGGSRGRISGRGLASCRGKAAFQRSKLRSRRYLYSAMPRPTLSAALCVVLAAACCTSVMAAALDDGPVDTGTRPAQQQLAAAPAALASAADFVAAAWSRLPHCPAQAPWLLQMQRVEDSCSRRLCRSPPPPPPTSHRPPPRRSPPPPQLTPPSKKPSPPPPTTHHVPPPLASRAAPPSPTPQRPRRPPLPPGTNSVGGTQDVVIP